MKSALLALPLTFLGLAWADHPDEKDVRQVVLMEGLGSIHHPVSTKNADAQKFFDQGLRLIYAFNHDEARRSFQRAAELDPKLAMAHWGMALAVGPNYNLDAEEAALKEAYAAIQKAQELAKNASVADADYVKALAMRYAADPKKAEKKTQAEAYKKAMGELSRKYPDDLDAATLYAESAMNLRPWQLWTQDGKPAEGTPEILGILEGVLRRNPEHTGACHYYIHAIEASPYPERGLPAADRLAKLAPGAGHLVHMPAHIYHRVGDYAASAAANEKAAEVDRAYIAKYKVQGVYPMMYYSHNLHFLAVAQAMQGRFADAKKAADQLLAHIGPHVKDMPMLEFAVPTPTLIQVRFGKWDDILGLPEPEAKLTIARSIRHFARGLAFAAIGKLKEANAEHVALQELHKAMPEDLTFGERNLAKKVVSIPDNVLAARIAVGENRLKDAIAALEKAVELEDALSYIEPADWYIPVREMLGAVHLLAKNAAAAEKVFRTDLTHNPRSPRSLFGLMACLKAQDKMHDARFVGQEFEAAWRRADVGELRVGELMFEASRR